MKFLDLCSGIGGFSIGLEWAGMTCAGQVEIDPFCTRVLEEHWPDVPRWKDLKNERDYDDYPAVDLVCGGYPCQPFSQAGKRRGSKDDRHLWPCVFRIVQRLRPAWCLFENVVGHVSMGLDAVLTDLESAGYTTGTVVIPACAVGAWHERSRVWIIAYSDGERREEYDVPTVATETGLGDGATIFGLCSSISPFEPRVVRSVHGIPGSAHRVKALGNAVVPQVVKVIGLSILEAERFR